MLNNQLTPKVSIIIPVYNGSDYLKEAIDSALCQTYKNCEILVINDGSTDSGKTEEIAHSYGDKIRYIYKDNGGVSSALNLGIKEMKGEYFSWLSHDDKYSPYKIEHLVELLKKYNSNNLVALTGVTHIDKNSNRVKDVEYAYIKDKVYTGIEVIEYMLDHGGLNGCAMLIPRGAFETCGGFNEMLRYNQDALMWYQIFGNGYNLIVDTENKDTMYRLHANQASKTRRDLLLHDSLEMCKIIMPMLIRHSKKENNLLKKYAKRIARHDCKDAVYECISRGMDSNILTIGDAIYLKTWLLIGKIRNVLKRIYLELRLK